MDEALIKRVPPHSIEAEQSVVGAMLMIRMPSPVRQRLSAGMIFIKQHME